MNLIECRSRCEIDFQSIQALFSFHHFFLSMPQLRKYDVLFSHIFFISNNNKNNRRGINKRLHRKPWLFLVVRLTSPTSVHRLLLLHSPSQVLGWGEEPGVAGRWRYYSCYYMPERESLLGERERERKTENPYSTLCCHSCLCVYSRSVMGTRLCSFNTAPGLLEHSSK